jgi:predicted Fe-S protein YdhL (DUF1289 family)/vacuolar-type H+-ATPase subunit H
MAHIAKYKAASCGHMLAHYRRDASSLGRENIDPTREGENMVLAHYTNKDGKLVVGQVLPREGTPNWSTIERRIERVNENAKAAGKRATRKDAVVMADVVVTLPENVRKGDEGRFFRLTYWYLSNKFGRENMMGGFVHGDEVLKDGTAARAHMHVPFTPILDGRFNYKKMCPRSFYQSMHKELGDYLEKRLGYRPEVELAEETRAQRVYTDKSVDIDKVRGAVDRAVVRPAEDEAARIVAAAKEEAAALLNEAETRKAELVTEIAEREGELEDVMIDIEDATDRLECLRQRADGVARDVEELRPIAAEIGRWEAADRAGKRAILDSIAARCAGAARAIGKAVEELGDRIWALMRPRKAQRTERGLDDVMREATDVARAAKALSRNHVAPTNSRPRGQAR